MTSAPATNQDRLEYKGKSKYKHLVMVATLVASVIYLTWRALYTLPWDYSKFELFCGLILLFCEGMTVIESFNLIINSRNVKVPEMPVISDDQYPEVDILVVTHNEEPELLYKTVNGCKYLDYPDKSKIHIYICDDGNRPAMKELADHMGVNYFGFDGNTTAKAGNLNYALARTHSPHVVIFDSDMIPTSNFLTETVPYFYLPTMIRDENTGKWRMRTEEERKGQKPVGYVQTRQSFYNPDMLQRNLYLERNAPCDLDYYYREVNVCRMWSNSVAFGGTNCIFARQALDDAGGIVYSITEDTATSIEILGKGYIALGLDKELAHGIAPDTAVSFIIQRQRWSRGTSHDITSLRFLRSNIPFWAKLSFFTSYIYWWTFFRRFVFIMCPILWGVFGVVVANVTLFQVLAVWVPYAVLYTIAVRVMSENTQSTMWSVVVDTVQMPYLLYPVIAGTLKLPGSKFKVTDKDRIQGRNSSLTLAIPHIALAILSVIAIVFCSIQVFVYKFQGSVIPLFWLVYNMYALINSIIYYWGRSNSRYYERLPVAIPVTIRYGGRVLEGQTNDISEGGMAVFLDAPEYLPYDAAFDVETTSGRYRAAFKARVRQVWQAGGRWKYSLMIAEMAEKDQQEYYQILYDRNHLLPRVVDMHVVSDMKRVFKGLTSTPQRGERRLPRIHLRIPAPTDEAGVVDIVNFNYQFIVVAKKPNLPERLTVRPTNGVSFTCVLDRDFAQNVNSDLDPLYAVENWKDLAVNPVFHDFLMAHLQHEKRIAAGYAASAGGAAGQALPPPTAKPALPASAPGAESVLSVPATETVAAESTASTADEVEEVLAEEVLAEPVLMEKGA